MRRNVSRRRLASARGPLSPRQVIARQPALRIAILAFGAAIVLALAVDVVRRLQAMPRVAETVEPQPGAFVLGLDDRAYTDPEGRFTAVVPAPWRVRTGPRVAPDDAVLVGPAQLEFAVRVTRLDHRSFSRLVADVYAIEDYWGIEMHIETVEDAQGRPIVRRRIRLMDREILAFDFLEGHWGHHLQFRAPRGELDRYTTLFLDLLAAYRPHDPEAPPPPGEPPASP